MMIVVLRETKAGVSALTVIVFAGVENGMTSPMNLLRESFWVKVIGSALVSLSTSIYSIVTDTILGEVVWRKR